MTGIDGQEVFIKRDLAQMLTAIVTMHRRTAAAGRCSADYNDGVLATIEAIAAALGVDVDTYNDTVTVEVRR